MNALNSVNSVLSGYAEGFKLVPGLHSDAIERFTLLGVNNAPRLLLPLDPPLLRKATKGFLDGRHISIAIPPIVQFSKLLKGPCSSICGEYSLISETNQVAPIRALIAEVLSRNDFQMALRFSFNRPNGKTVAMAISDTGDILCYVKIGSEAMTSELVKHESSVLELYEDADVSLVFPKRLHSGTWVEDHNVLITESMDLKRLPQDSSSAHKAAFEFASYGANERNALSESSYWQDLNERVVNLGSEVTIHSELIGNVLSDIDRLWGSNEFTFGPSHGDWTRANVGIVGERVAAFDWERFTHLSPHGIDVVHFVINEEMSRPFARSLDVGRIIDKSQHALVPFNLSLNLVQPLVALAFLEMVIRFKSAQNAGLNAVDTKFAAALLAILRKKPV